MRRLLLASALIIGMFALIQADTSALGQAKKEPPKDTKKVETKEEPKVGGIEIYKGKSGFRYRILDANGKTVAMPLPQMSWETKEEVAKALEALKETLNKATPKESKE